MRDLRKRTFQFALDSIRFCGTLPKNYEFSIIKGQLMRASTSVGANYRSSCRARSKVDFISKVSIVEEEADECMYWLEMLRELGIKSEECARLRIEANEIVSMMVASKKTARAQPETPRTRAQVLKTRSQYLDSGLEQNAIR